MLLKTTVHDKLVTKVNVLNTSGFFFKIRYNADK